jgi:folate-dependent phosphoribosylglycinamide formyltransferase PurN
LRGVVLLIDRSDLSRIIYHALAREFKIDAVLRESKVSRWTMLRRRIKRLGLRTAVGQAAFAMCIAPCLRLEGRRRRTEILQTYDLDDKPIPADTVIDVPSVNHARTRTILRELSPAVVVVNGTRLLDEGILSAVDSIFLNTHVGITPLYRGTHGGYWALASGDREHCGVTVHKIDTGIDTGEIVAQARVEPSADDNFCTYPLLQISYARKLLKTAVHEALAGRLRTIPPPAGKSRLWSHPTAFQYLRNRIESRIR